MKLFLACRALRIDEPTEVRLALFAERGAAFLRLFGLVVEAQRLHSEGAAGAIRGTFLVAYP